MARSLIITRMKSSQPLRTWKVCRENREKLEHFSSLRLFDSIIICSNLIQI